ncbi:SDR family oxidoreductase [Desertivirga arenae]|uniref:SDR family oxidoreductase n=1 Tax=Desertivirga arenae TaxID=2810309 RepID=UPI001A95843B|nr:SDR family oxidoreductase [Pedobacter sp. SYSU D00823]
MYKNKYHSVDLSLFSFLITGGAGFIGSNLVEYLLKYGAGKVRVLDNFSTGSHDNITPFLSNPAFELFEGDIRDMETCNNAIDGIDYVSHQAALGSVPRSINDPVTTNAVNISGFLNMLWAIQSRERVKRFVYAASSSTYGDSKELPKVEERIGRPLSPYAVTKYVNELYADVFAKTYGMNLIGLRYFNVFGPRQNPEGEYAAVIPKFIKALKAGEPAIINGDGEQTRDFTFIENAVQANVRAFFSEEEGAVNQVYNIAFGESISLNQLWALLNKHQGSIIPAVYNAERKGDVRNSLADITKANSLLSYNPQFSVEDGLKLLLAENECFQQTNK